MRHTGVTSAMPPCGFTAAGSFCPGAKGVGWHVEHCRQSICNECADADAALADMDPDPDFHGGARRTGAAVGPARPEAHSFRALGHHPARSMAGSRPGQARPSKTTTCCSCPTSTAPGTSISTPLPTAFRAGWTCSGTPAPNIRTRSRSRPSRTISAPTRSIPTTTTTPRRARRSATSRRRCACA